MALVASAMFAAPADAAPQGQWVLPAADLSAPGQNAYDPQIAVGPDGAATAVWERSDGSSDIAQTSTRPPAGVFGPVEDLSLSGHDVRDPQVAIGDDGTTTVVWYRSGGANDIVQSRTRPPGGEFGPVEDLSATGQNARNPRVAIGDDGTTTVVWYRSDGANDIVQSRTRPPGGVFLPVENVSAAGQDARGPQVAVGPDGTSSLIWSRNNGANRIVQVRTRATGGGFGLIQNLSAVGQDAITPAVATGPDGSVATVWTRSNGANTIVQTRSRTANGIFGPTQPLSEPGEDGGDPQLDVGPDGTAAVAWFRSSGSNDIVQARVRPANGAFGSVENVTGPVVAASDLGITVGPDGTATATWYGRPGLYVRSQAATRPPGGPFMAPVFLSADGQNSSYPQADIGPDGVATAIWTRYDGSSDIVQVASTLAPEFPLTVENRNPNRGKVESSPGGIDCGEICSAPFASYTEVRLTAIPAKGSRFAGWSGECAGMDPACAVKLVEARAVTAAFRVDLSQCPPRRLKPGKLKRNRKKGIAKLKFKAGGKGRVVLRGSKKVRKAARKVRRNGKGGLKVRARGKAARKLRKRGRIRVKVKLVYRPGGGCPNAKKTKKIRLLRK